jgi:hypothetical protein
MAVITRTNRVLNVVSVVRDVVTDNKSMVGGTAIAGHALAVHLLSQQQLPGYQPRPWNMQRERMSPANSWPCWRLAKQGVAHSQPAPLGTPCYQGPRPADWAASRKPSLISKRLTDKRGFDARGFIERMAIPTCKA